MSNKKTVTVDFTGCKYYLEMFEIIRVAFDFPEWQGTNWSAFWDSLTFDSPAEKVIVIGADKLPAEYNINIMLKILEGCKQDRIKHGHKFDYEVR